MASNIVNWHDKSEANSVTNEPKSPTTAGVLDWLIPAVKAESSRRWNMSPEMYHVVDDLIESWATQLVNSKRDILRTFVMEAKFQTCEDLWVLLDAQTKGTPCFRRGFAGALHNLAKELELEGCVIGEGYAKFMRQRYNPEHQFSCELANENTNSAVNSS